MKENYNTDSGKESSVSDSKKSNLISIPSINLPKGGGAISGIEEKFQVNSVTGTSSFSIPIPFSPSRGGFTPGLGLSYNSGSGNSSFGIGWNLGIPSITRKTEKKLPEYKDNEDSDIFILSGVEDMIPVLEKQTDGSFLKYEKIKTKNGKTYKVKRYRPRIESSFTRIEKFENIDTGEVFWITISTNNQHSYFGLTDESRIFDPKNPNRVFEWLLCQSHDDKGNICIYQYKKEDFKGINKKLSEKNKLNNCTQTYLKQVCYGNKTPYYLGDPIPHETDFMFRTVFDYGEHDTAVNIPKDINLEKNIWSRRNDPFSSFRSGFEIRTYRRCHRILMFHCFDANELPHSPYLTKSLELFYNLTLEFGTNDTAVEGFSFLEKAKQNGHLWDNVSKVYKTKFLPEIEISYQKHEWNTEVKSVTDENWMHAPAGLADKSTLWIDLFSEGISGILTEETGEWYYKSNLGNGTFSNAKPILSKPSFKGITKGKVAVQELKGDGVKYLVALENEPKGFFKLTEDEDWEPMQNFETLPNVDFFNRNTRPIDLNGDGLTDLLFTEEDKFRWYPGLGTKGFKTSQTVFKEIDEEKGPAIVFSDREQCIFLADMSGDGLTDIVRIKNNEICYWPNLGYGFFGGKVGMDNAPIFDHPDSFNPLFLRLADIDGSGTTDVIYLGKNDFRVWMNLNGNEWTVSPQIIKSMSNINDLSDVAVLDFLGSGTACIVYSSPIITQPLQYIDLMGSKKPGLFTGYHNNAGKIASIEYKSSTFYYLEDKKSGNKWITKLPFPVHCISKVRTEDKIRETVFISSYKYRHGYFDHEEREFRGFARVEQFDTEDFSKFKINDAKNVVDEILHQAPVRSVSWFHTGAFLKNKKILHQCENEYFKNGTFSEYDIPEPKIPDLLSEEELKEAYRACKGMPLRNEVYADDNSDKSLFPYSASQSTVEIRLVQPKAANKYASFLVVPSETISYNYDRNPADPRISQSFVLETDELGNLKKSCSVVHPRIGRPTGANDIVDRVWDEQNKRHIFYNEAIYTQDIIEEDSYRIRAGYDSKAYEINGINVPSAFFYTKEFIKSEIAGTTEILFEVDFDATPQKRLSGHSRGYFFKDDLTGPMPLGELSKLAIPHKTYQLVFTEKLVSKYYGTKVTSQMLLDAKYVHSENDKHWWSQRGDVIFPPSPKTKFYTPIGARDVFGNESFVEYDQYQFLVVKTTDAILNSATAKNDYRTLSPVMLTDPNLNRCAIETDELGLVIKSAVMGKEGAGEGDTLDDPTVKMEYDLFNWKNNHKPNFVHVYAREIHGVSNTKWQESYVYSDGGGGVIMSKSQAKAGKAKRWNPATKAIEEIDANPRWIGNGRTIFNNKGNPVKKYEPYFSTTFEYESEDALVETGFTSVLYYDAVNRNIKTEFPNGTFIKAEFDSWHSKSYDVNDTVKESQWYIDRGSPDPLVTLVEPADPETRAAWLAAKHNDTPRIIFFNSLGGTSYAIMDHGEGKTSSVYSEADSGGRFSKAFDQLGRCVTESYINISGQSIYTKTAEKGERWVFTDVMGRTVRIWDNNALELYSTYDKLHRTISTFVKEGNAETLFGHFVYGDLFPDAAAKAKNMKGQIYQIYDQAGVITIKDVDFKGNASQADRKLTKEYKQNVNWNILAPLNNITDIENASLPFLEDETFISLAEIDALNRPVRTTLADKTVIEPTYDAGNSLESLKIKIRGNGSFISFLDSQDYDAKGQRQFAKYGNGSITQYFYDPKNFQLINLITKKSDTDADNQSIQNLKYTFDPAGNILQQRDDAQQTHFFKNTVVYPESKYEYDALYQLKKASGREHASLIGDAQRNEIDLPYIKQLPHQNDLTAVRIYSEEYEYDDCGNIKLLKHIATGANWSTKYKYQYEDDPNNKTNRLKGTNLTGDTAGIFSAVYNYDSSGNMTSMPHLSIADSMRWNFMEQLKEVNLGGGGKAYYSYSLSGDRIRKVIERNGGKKLERIYLGLVEIYREAQNNAAPDLERYTLHIVDNTGKIAQVDTKTKDVNNQDPVNLVNENVIRYQYNNHLGSASLETDQNGNVISYEEYHPYGTTAYRVCNPNNNVSLKRYRFSGKERDDETGFYYFGVRYYAAWLGRWTSSDPGGFVDGLNLYRYCKNNPITFNDAFGFETRLTSFNAPPQAINYSGTSQQVIDHFNNNPIVGTGTFYNDETGETFTRPMSVRVSVAGVTRVTDAQGVEFWQISDFTFVPHSGEVLSVPETPPDEESESTSGGTGGASSSSSSSSSGSGGARGTSSSSDSTGSGGSSSSSGTGDGSSSTGSSSSSTGTAGTAPIGDSLRATLQEVARPASITGSRPTGTLHLWSGSGKADAQAAIRRAGSGWMMGDINGHPTPEHAAGELEFARARARTPGGMLPQAEMDSIWGPRSASVVGRGAFSGHPVEAHGTPSPTAIQPRYEWPARSIGGGLGGGLFFGSGMFTAITGGQDPNPLVAIPLVLAGVGEATSGIIYGSGAILASSESMVIGAAGGTAFGGAAAAIGFGVASYRSFDQGDNVGGVVNALGAIGGVLLIASLFTPVGWVGLAGVGLVALAGGFNLGRWLGS